MLGCFLSAAVTNSNNDRPDGSCIPTGLRGLKFLLFACQGLHGGQLLHVLAAGRLLADTGLFLSCKEQMAERHCCSGQTPNCHTNVL